MTSPNGLLNNKSIAGAASTVLLLTFVSKLIGFLESAIMAAYFGTSTETDLFFLANSIVNRFVFTLFSGILVVGVTKYNDSVQKNGKCGGSRFVSALFAVVIPIAVIAMVCILLLAPAAAQIMAKNYAYDVKDTLTSYLRILSIAAVLYATTTILTAVLNANQVFWPAAILGTIQNAVMIGFIIALSSAIGVRAVVYGFICSYLLQVVFLFLCTRKLFCFSAFTLSEDIDVKSILIMLGPLILGEATAEINVFIDQYLATKSGAGAVAALSYSETVNDAVSALFIQSATSTLLAFFSKMVVEKKTDEMIRQLTGALKLTCGLLLPISIVTLFGSERIISFLFARGSFDAQSIRITALALTGYGAGFMFKASMVILKRPFYAIKNTMIPMIVGIVNVLINIILSILFYRYWGLFGITIGTSISYLAASVIYLILLKRRFREFTFRDTAVFTIKILIAAAASSAVLFGASRVPTVTRLGDFAYLAFITLICITTFVLALLFLKTEEAEALWKKISAKALRK